MKRIITTAFMALLLCAVSNAQSAAPAPIPAGVSQGVTSFIKAKVSDIYGVKSVTCSPLTTYKTVNVGLEAEKKARYYGTLLNVLIDLKPTGEVSELVRNRWQKAYDNTLSAYKSIQAVKHSPGFAPDAIHYTIYKTNTTFNGKSWPTYVAWDNESGKAVYLYFENDGIAWNSSYTQVPNDFDLLEFFQKDQPPYEQSDE